ncbi:MAG: metal-dependent transcriptional regulator [Ignavibacterium sp.]|nr:metal-dependent transcriptional regulator [Ignavibacterium sp.]MCX7611571.1 metal-dependent transcriptional regulator [Ignavibacterium sp.]MDW8376299.1 metal-dependent transcriptional regulator [Ignavibacteriales bacterium]
MSLFIYLVLIFIASILFLKRKQIVFLFKKIKNEDDKILQEDILKNIYQLQKQNTICKTETISTRLNEDKVKVQNSINKLQKLNFVNTVDEEIHLTESGKTYALKIIRFHRLYEKFLADKTNLNEKTWHKVADEIEHKLNQEDAEKIAAQIGNPVYDPHGDPIPSSSGELPEKIGISLSEMKHNEISVVLHIEDEPHNIYENIVNKGIYKGIQIRFLGIFNNEVSFYANEKLCSLSLDEANNIQVGIPKLEKIHLGEFKKLSSLSVGEKGKIIGIAKSLRGQQRRRIMDLGIVPGTIIEAELESISGDPVAYRVRGTTIALRKNQAEKIYIEKI